MAKIKMTPEKVRNLYKLVQQGDTQEEIGRRYKISRAHVSKIALGMSDNPPPHARWAHIWQELKQNNSGKLIIVTDTDEDEPITEEI